MRRRQFLIAILLGLLALAAVGLRLRLAPPMRDNTILVTIERAGSFAEQLEREITIPLEDRIAILDGVSAIHSLSTRGRSSIEVRFDPLVTPQLAYIRVREAVERIEHLLPRDARRPSIERRSAEDRPLFIVALALDSRLDFAEIGRRFGAVEGSGRVTLGGDTRSELVVQVVPPTLTSAGIPIERLAQALQDDAAIGGFGPPQGAAFTIGSDYRDADYLRSLDIAGVELGQLAGVEERTSQPETISRVNGVRRVVLSVYPTDSTHPVRLCNQLRRLAADYRSAEVLYDYGRQIERTLGRAVLALLVAIAMVTIGLKWLYAIPLRGFLFPALSAVLAACAATRPAGGLDLVSLLGLVAALSLTLDLCLVPALRARPDCGALFHAALLCGSASLVLLAPPFRSLWIALLTPALAASVATSITMVLGPHIAAHTRPQRPDRRAHAGRGAWPTTLLLIVGSAAALWGLARIELRPFYPEDRQAHFFRLIFRTGVPSEEIIAATRPLEEALTRLSGVRFVSALHSREVVRFYVALNRQAVAGKLGRLVYEQARLIPEAFVLFADDARRAERLQLTLRGDDPLQLRRVAAELGRKVADLDGVQEIISDFATADSAIALNLDLQRLGAISPGRVHSTLYWALAQPVAAKRHTPQGESDIRIVVDRPSKPTLQDILRLPIVDPTGEQSEIGSLVSVGERPRLDTIRRTDRRRSVMLTIVADIGHRLPAQIEALIQETRAGSAADLELVLRLPSDRLADGGRLLRRILLPMIASLIGWALLLLRFDDHILALRTLAIALSAALPAILFHSLMPISLSGLTGLLTAMVGALGSVPQALRTPAVERPSELRAGIGYLLWMLPLAAIDAPLFAPFVLHAMSVRIITRIGVHYF